ncbi:hypothetical protein KHA80_16350 [Anaerobacillus sp. HL2]|nr:hypothetical protein KHA80_16350 [Anaerobacillus sp. HL2]
MFLEAYCRSQISKAIVTVENQTRLAGLIESVKIIKKQKINGIVKLSDESGEMMSLFFLESIEIIILQ